MAERSVTDLQSNAAHPVALSIGSCVKRSARNVLAGKAVALTNGATTANVKIEIAAGAVISMTESVRFARKPL